jgi:hypothetical protein
MTKLLEIHYEYHIMMTIIFLSILIIIIMKRLMQNDKCINYEQ